MNPAFSSVEEKCCPPQPGLSSSSTMTVFSASLSVGRATSNPKHLNVCAVITSHLLENMFKCNENMTHKKEVIKVPTSVVEMKNHKHQVKIKFEA